MILRRLRVRRFWGLDDRTFEFAPGINVISGPNEAGKSTLRTAIRAALYDNPATTAQTARAYRAWGADQPPVLELEFEVDGARFALVKDFGRRETRLRGEDGAEWDQHRKIQESITGALGLATDRVFSTTAEVAQAELERVQLSTVGRELGRMLGGGEDAATAIRKLQVRIAEMEKGLRAPTKHPGTLRALQDAVTALADRHRRLTAQAADLARKQQELAALEGPLKALRDELAAKERLLEQNREMLQQEKDLARLRGEAESLARRVDAIAQALATLDQLGRDLEALTAGGMPDESLVQQARDLSRQIGLLEDQMAALEAPEEPAPVDRPWARPAAVFGLLLIVLGGILAGVTSILWGAAVGLMGAAVGLAAWRAWREIQRAREAAVRTEERRRQRAELAAQADRDRARLSEILRQTGSADLPTAEQRLANYRGRVTAREEQVKVLAALRAGEDDDALRRRLDELRQEIYVLKKGLDDPERASRRLIPLEVESLAQEVDRLRREADRLTEHQKRLAWEVEHRRSEADELPAVEEQLADAQEALAAARRRHRVYQAALDGLQEARRLVERPVREVVASRAGEFLRILSGGRYSRLEVERDTLDVWVWSDEAGGRVEPREPHLSRGTVDLVYLSLRLALVGALAEGRRPPLLLDDPFITFDPARRAAAATLLAELARTHQIFLFTAGADFRDVADRVIELPPPAPPARAAAAGAAEDPQADSAAQPVAVDAAPSRPESQSSVGPLWDHVPNPQQR